MPIKILLLQNSNINSHDHSADKQNQNTIKYSAEINNFRVRVSNVRELGIWYLAAQKKWLLSYDLGGKST